MLKNFRGKTLLMILGAFLATTVVIIGVEAATSSDYECSDGYCERRPPSCCQQ